jgi:predicted RNase H-like nuclease (RuvC/YqgF family)
MIRLFSMSCLILTAVLASLAANLNPSQDLEAWKAALNAAQNGRGCESIPYSNYRDQCERQQSAVEDLCKTESWSCKGLETRSLRENIKNLDAKITALKSDRDKLKDQRSNAQTDSEKDDLDRKISEVEKDIYEKSKELDFMKKSLETDLSDIEIRLYKGGKCLEARSAVQSAFKDASSDADRENDPEIKAIGKQLIEFWSKKRDEHEKAFQDTNQGLENCKKCKDGDL